MEEEYWKQFLRSGDIKDYLYYKGIAICRQVIEKYTLSDEDQQKLSSQE
ncbi:MAG: hypothetical protein HFG82_00035 [Dorea sp.]|jgi:hypothetical protein|nr:hypothetical protein [Dorea sp.]